MTLKNSQVVFSKPGVVEFQSATEPELKPDSILIETEYSIISPGTELACLAGSEWWAPLPFVPGYGSVGKIAKLGGNVQNLAVGQRIFTYGRHSKYSLADAISIPLTSTIDPAKAVFARMAAVSITSLRASETALGDTVAVFGLGLVGNLAAQLFALSGCQVVGIDLSPKRRELAKQCGIQHVYSPQDNLNQIISDLSDGKMCKSVVDATGVSAVAEKAGSLAGKGGELILLGSPRGTYQADLTAFLNQSHLWDHGCITVKGAHEWRYPVQDSPHTRFSIERNVRQILKLIESKKLVVDPLLSHKLSPKECATAYEGLKKDKDAYYGVIFDWTNL